MSLKNKADLGELEKNVERIQELLTVLVKATLAPAFDAHLKDKNHRLLYEFTGKLTIRELARRTDFSVGKISGLWEKWAQAGLLIKEGARYKRVF